MYPHNDINQTNGHFSPIQAYEQTTRSPDVFQNVSNNQSPLVCSSFIRHHADLITEKGQIISSDNLAHILSEICNHLENVCAPNESFINLTDVVGALTHVRQPTLASLVQHKFFSLLNDPFLRILRKWNTSEGLNATEGLMFFNLMTLSKPVFSEIIDPNNYPPWLTDQVSLDTIASSFNDIANSEKFFAARNKNETRSFLILLNVYVDYQQDIHNAPDTNQDKLVQLLDPVVNCLTSQFYIDTFHNVENRPKSMSKKDKFFLVKCPAFLINYNGARLEKTMDHVLTTMLPKYIKILDKLVPDMSKWNQQTIRAVTQMLKIVNHATTYTKLASSYLLFVDYILKIIDEPKFYNTLQNTLASRQTNLFHYGISVLSNMLREPTILAHIKQKQVTPIFLRLTSAPYEPLVHNIYQLLAYTTTEEDIKSMKNPGKLLSTVTQALENAVNKKTDNENQVIQLLGTLKGLLQHDQIKEEVLKQNTLQILINCASKVPQTALALLFQTLWTSSFSQDIAKVLRGNTELLQQIQTVSKNTRDESLKKAAEGLVWKLIKEPEFLIKAAQRAAEEGESTDEDSPPKTKIIIGPDGKEQVVTIPKRSSIAPTERTFQYDIMISYCHADKDLIVKIHKFLLDQGFKIWIDLNNMFGPAMSAMADAVENSEFVLLCMSDSYKQSTYCQAEAEYAFNCKRRLVPLIVRPGYKADGWLGFMIGTRIYVDFGFFDFDTACGKLMDEISRQQKRPFASKTTHVAQQQQQQQQQQQPQPEKPAVPTPAIARVSTPIKKITFLDKLPDIYKNRKAGRDFNNKCMNKWSESDVLDFLFSRELIELMPLCEKMDGSALIQLYKMCLSRHNRTYSILNDELKTIYKTMLPVGTYTRFLIIMERVVNDPTQEKIVLSPSQPRERKTSLPRSQSQPRQRKISFLQPPPLPVPPPPVNIPYSPYDILVTSTAPPPPVNIPYSPYDILVTSTAPPSQVLQMVERVGSHWRVKAPWHY